MPRSKALMSLLFLAFFGFYICPASGETDSLAEKRILLLYSYSPGFPTSSKVLEGIRSGFADNPPSIEIEYMDSKRLNDAVSQANFLQLLRYKLIHRPSYDLVVTADDNALDFMLRHRDELFPQVPVVFLGVNDIKKAMSLSSSPWITGVVEAASFEETITLARALFPQRNNIQILVDDTTSGQADLTTIRGLISRFADSSFHEIPLTEHSWQSLADSLSQLGETDSLLLVSAYRDRQGEAKTFSESLSYIMQHSKVPIFHMWEHGIGEGVLGGIVVSHREQGRQAALMAKRILSGQPASAIKILQKSPNIPIFDIRQLSRFDVPDHKLPPDSEILFRPDTFWDRFRQEISITIAIVSVLFFLSLHLARRNIEMRRLSNELLKKSSILRLLMDTLPDLAWIKDKDGVYLACNKRFEQFFGAAEEDIIGHTDYDFVDKELADFFREKDKLAIEAGKQCVNEEQVQFLSDGHVEILETIKTPVINPERGDLLGVLGVGRDITQRKADEQAIREAETRRKELLDTSLDGIVILTEDFGVIEANRRFSQMLGYSPQEMLNLHAWDWNADMNEQEIRASFPVIVNCQYQFETRHQSKDGTLFDVEVSLSGTEIAGKPVQIAIVRDIRERKEEERIKDLRQRLIDMLYDKDLEQLLQIALDTAEQLLESEIGFYHFVEDDKQSISLQSWSTRTLDELRHAEGAGTHYPVGMAGVWADCIRQGQPVIHNDYQALPHKQGLPEGHALVKRELTVPVRHGERIVAIMGVGNKAKEYDDHDVEIALRIAEMAYGIVERKRAEQQIQFMAFNDVLTGLPNRQLFADRLQQAASLCHRLDTLLAIGYLDLDGFKQVNDRHGHAVGDKLLIQLAKRLKEDLREGDTLARLGGDEFVILLSNLESIHHGEEIIQRVLNSIKQPYDVEHHRLHISASIGVTLYPHDDADPDTLLRHADQAMYKAKESGKNTYQLYDPIQDNKAHTHRQAIREFEQALRESQLLLHYQPRITLRDAELCGVEALVRWQHPKRGLLQPAYFIPIIKNSPLEAELDEWVLQTAMEQQMRWREQGLILPVSVNISPHSIQQSSFPGYLEQLLSRFPDDMSDHLELEVLETSAIGDTAHVSEIMNACANLGVHFSLDDFGTGYSSLTYFHRLPISILKIDRSFVHNMLTDQRDQDIVEGVLHLAHALKRPVVAEGVESIEIGMMLLQLGCRYAQGYGIARPMPPEALPDWSVRWGRDELWQNLHMYSQGPTSFHDINVAIFTHHNWTQRLINHIQSGAEATPSMDGTKCQFAHWYHGIGTSQYGKHKHFASLEAKHHAVHELGQELLYLAENRGRASALSRLDELKALSDELTELLGKIAVT